ncbi:MAG: acyl-CoA carboxylase subunit beta [Halioglobus sp.]
MTNNREGWDALLAELQERTERALQMGGKGKIEQQHARGRLTARERVASLCDNDTFSEYGALAGGNHPGGDTALAADALVAGVGKIGGNAVVVIAEDFTVKGGSIGHPNAAKRTRMVRLAMERQLPVVLMLDGAGERAGNQSERYPNTPNDLQLVADLKGQVPVVTLVLGVSAGHGALTGAFADLIIMTQGSAMFSAGPPLVSAALGIDASPEELGGAAMHTRDSGVAHNLASNEEDAFAMARYFLAQLPTASGEAQRTDKSAPSAEPRELDALLDLIPTQANQAYSMHKVLQEIVDSQSLFELQPAYGASLITALARIGGTPCMVIANQPTVQAGAITTQGARKAAHFIEVASNFGLPLICLLDNPGVMPGPEAERSGALKAAAEMFLAQRRYSGNKIVVTLRKAFGFGSSVMGMNPWDKQSVSLALPSVSLGGVPAIGGAEAARASKEEAQQMEAAQSGAWVPADAVAFDKVVAPQALRNEIIAALAR